MIYSKNGNPKEAFMTEGVICIVWSRASVREAKTEGT